MSDDAHPHEIVIIKRGGGGHEDEHHGGVWKIAFADFMTAMMAFFLVMWLISANDKTKAVIARYFNPVQLVDSTPQPKGLEDPKAGSPSVMPKANVTPEAKAETDKADAKADAKAAKAKPNSDAKAATEAAAAADTKTKHGEDELFKDPYAILAEIAGRSDAQPLRDKAKAPSEGEKGGSGAVGLKGGAAYRDPFEPLPLPASTAPDAPSFAPSTEEATMLPLPPSAAAKPEAAAQPAQAAPGTAQPATPPSPPVAGAGAVQSGAGAAQKDQAAAEKAPAGSLAGRIEAIVAAAQGKAPAGIDAPKLDIRHTAEGTLIDLTDGTDFSMFGSASAEPSPKMVRLMEKIGRAIKAEKGPITIRGYTDDKPFRSDTYDNWRLSAARAHMAHYMLVRGGVDEQRFERIEGYADRKPKNPKDPGAAENRRIEILIRDTAP